MASIIARGGRLYAKVPAVDGTWKRLRTPFVEGEDARAQAWADDLERQVLEQRAMVAGELGPMTIRRWVDTWSDEQRDRGVVDWKRNKAWLVDLVVSTIGDMLVRDIRTPHVVALFKVIRASPSRRTGKSRAPRTLHNIHGVLHTMFRDAVLAGHLEHAPESLDERQLGRKVDADPEWRSGAMYTRDEVQTLISTHKIPWDRRVAYAIELLAGARPGEAAALRFRHYDASKQPLGGLRIARSYSGRQGKEKGTKTDAIKHVPVHPTLAAILAEWKLTGWAQVMGREPTPDDLIVPIPPADSSARTRKDGEPFRTDYYARRRWVETDLPALGWRHRRHYDTRATFITLAVDDGANAQIIRERVTHTKPRRDGFDFYDRGDHWIETCREVAKLKITRLRDPHDNVVAMPMRAVAGDDRSRTSDVDPVQFGPSVVQAAKASTMSSTSKLRRRVSKADGLLGGDTPYQSNRDVESDEVSPSDTVITTVGPRHGPSDDPIGVALGEATDRWRADRDVRALRRALVKLLGEID